MAPFIAKALTSIRKRPKFVSTLFRATFLQTHMRKDHELDRLHAEQLTLQRAQINRANALHSTGPITHEGRAISSLNAVKTGLTGRTVLLHNDDADVYRQHLAAYAKEYQPAGLREQELVQSLADTQWRLQRIPGLEMAIYAHGRAENQEYCALHGTTGTSLIELGTFLKYEKQLKNLQLQESRLQRRYEKEMAELRSLQKERKEQKQQDQPATGFEFSTNTVASAGRAGFSPRGASASPSSGPQQCPPEISAPASAAPALLKTA